MEVIGDKRKIQILLFLLEKGTVKKYDFLEIMKNMYIIDRHLKELEENGYITMNRIGMTYQISLTEKGKLMAEQLKKMNKLSEEKEEPIAEISKEKYDQITEDWKRLSFKPIDISKNWGQLSFMTIKDFWSIYFKESNFDGQGHDRTVKISILIDKDSIVRLYCDVDQSTTCWHVQYAWTLPKVQAWVQKYLKLHIEQLQGNEKSNDTLRKNINSTDNQNEENKR